MQSLTKDQRDLALKIMAQEAFRGQIVQIDWTLPERDLRIIQALERGVSPLRIAKTVNLSQPRIYQIREKWEAAKQEACKTVNGKIFKSTVQDQPMVTTQRNAQTRSIRNKGRM